MGQLPEQILKNRSEFKEIDTYGVSRAFQRSVLLTVSDSPWQHRELRFFLMMMNCLEPVSEAPKCSCVSYAEPLQKPLHAWQCPTQCIFSSGTWKTFMASWWTHFQRQKWKSAGTSWRIKFRKCNSSWDWKWLENWTHLPWTWCTCPDAEFPTSIISGRCRGDQCGGNV